MGGGRPLEVPLASMGVSFGGAVIVRTSPRVDKGQNPRMIGPRPGQLLRPGTILVCECMQAEFPSSPLIGSPVAETSPS